MTMSPKAIENAIEQVKAGAHPRLTMGCGAPFAVGVFYGRWNGTANYTRDQLVEALEAWRDEAKARETLKNFGVGDLLEVRATGERFRAWESKREYSPNHYRETYANEARRWFDAADLTLVEPLRREPSKAWPTPAALLFGIWIGAVLGASLVAGLS